MQQQGAATTGWHAQPVFISSTFLDMQQERDWLHRHVFPRLAESLRQRRVHLEPVDLRLGVEHGDAEDESAREARVLKVCLDEVERSRPFIVVLLGDRYGWVPSEDRVTAVAREQGLTVPTAGKSVTALEIESAILRTPGQRQRCLFFFRRPLPWGQLPESRRAEYSDAHSTDSATRDGRQKLLALKDRLRNDPELAPRVHEYTVDWDARRQCVSGLRSFGELVYQQLWAALDEETRPDDATPPQGPRTWQEQERAELQEFVEHRVRRFAGRTHLVARLLDTCRPPARDDAAPGSIRAACVVGPAGSGKSALFAQLHRQLDNDPCLVLLANSAGGTRLGSSVDAMLGRFVGELCRRTGVPERLQAGASDEEVEGQFYFLLRQASAEQLRVILLLDAVDQFEPTPRGRHLTWLKPQRWPRDTTIVATGIPCPATDAFRRLTGTDPLELPPVSPTDAADITRQVWARYHRAVSPRVLQVLLEAATPDGRRACGSPLWLTLASEQLNLMDADDFARARRTFSGSPVDRMNALLVDTATRLPPTVEDLYGWLLDRNEKSFGVAHARAFAVAVALSHAGWRETDLLRLVPRLDRVLLPGQDVPDLDELSLATLRRGFRAHVVRRGTHGQLDFFHVQMRAAVVRRYVPEESARRASHAAICDYLETLPADDPVAWTEQMRQLLALHDTARAAKYYAQVDGQAGTGNDRSGPTWALVDWLVEGQSHQQQSPRLAWLASWLLDAGLHADQLHDLAFNLQFSLLPLVQNAAGTGPAIALAQAVAEALEPHVSPSPLPLPMQRLLAMCYGSVGDLKRQLGDLDGALQAYWKSNKLLPNLSSFSGHEGDPGELVKRTRHDVILNHISLGDAMRDKRRFNAARRAYQVALEAAEQLTAWEPSNGSWQEALAVSCRRTGDVLRDARRFDDAIHAYRRCLDIAESLHASDPSNAAHRRLVATTHNAIGDVLREQGRPDDALLAFRRDLGITTAMAAADPSDSSLQHDASVTWGSVGNVLLGQGDGAGAAEAFGESLRVVEQLVAGDPLNARWQRDLCINFMRMAAAADAIGAPEAAEWHRMAYEQLAGMDRAGVMPATDRALLEKLSQDAEVIGDSDQELAAPGPGADSQRLASVAAELACMISSATLGRVLKLFEKRREMNFVALVPRTRGWLRSRPWAATRARSTARRARRGKGYLSSSPRGGWSSSPPGTNRAG